jgi:hypothetical protein
MDPMTGIKALLGLQEYDRFIGNGIAQFAGVLPVVAADAEELHGWGVVGR